MTALTFTSRSVTKSAELERKLLNQKRLLGSHFGMKVGSLLIFWHFPFKRIILVSPLQKICPGQNIKICREREYGGSRGWRQSVRLFMGNWMKLFYFIFTKKKNKAKSLLLSRVKTIFELAAWRNIFTRKVSTNVTHCILCKKKMCVLSFVGFWFVQDLLTHVHTVSHKFQPPMTYRGV